jgi:hypothetical protein
MNTKYSDEQQTAERSSDKVNRPPFQSRQSVVIFAPLQKVWEFGQDLSKIPTYHPRVNKVDLLSGTSTRKAGVSYRCHLKDGKNTCVEQDIEVIPMEKIVTKLPEDTMGLTKILPDYFVETTFTAVSENTTKIEFSHYYFTRSCKAKFINLIAKRRIAKEAEETLSSIKNVIEQANP